MAEKKRILYIVEAMGGGVFTYIVDLANELVNKYDMYIAYLIHRERDHDGAVHQYGYMDISRKSRQ